MQVGRLHYTSGVEAKACRRGGCLSQILDVAHILAADTAAPTTAEIWAASSVIKTLDI
jgi:hypothetical protein